MALKLMYYSAIQSMFIENLLEVELVDPHSLSSPLHCPLVIVATIC